MKYLKVYEGVVTNSFAGRDDGYPETKYTVYKDLTSLSKDFGNKKDERYFKLEELDLKTLKEHVVQELENEKKQKIEAKKQSLEEQISKLQNELNDLKKK